MIGKDVEWRTKTENTESTVFEWKFAFENLELHFWEINWLTSNNNEQIDREKQGFCVKETFVYITFEGTCPKKHSKSPTNHLSFTIKTSFGQKQTLLIL